MTIPDLNNRFESYRKYFVPTILFALILVIYISHHPTTVQIVDSGELVSRAYVGAVPHPPGYPLYLWIQRAIVSNLDSKSVFSAASLTNSAISILCLLLVFSVSRRDFIYLPLLPSLAFSFFYWRYSLLPDVFILNAAFVAAILTCYLFYFHNPFAQRLSVFIFPIALTNHHTAIFLFPLIAHTLWENRKNSAIWAYLGAGCLSFILLYSSLFLLQTDHILSWGRLSSVTDLLKHLLRFDYGTFKLSAAGDRAGFGNVAWYFLKTLMSDFLVVFIIAAMSLIQSIRKGIYPTQRWLICFACTVTYCLIFFSLTNVAPKNFGAEILGRFFIFPTIAFIFLALSYYYQCSLQFALNSKVFFVAVLLLVSSANYFKHSSANDFSKNFVVEDYARNLLTGLPETQTLGLITGDTELFSAQYVQHVLGIRPDIAVIAPNLVVHEWYYKKIRLRWPDFQVPFEKIKESNSILMDTDIIQPNLNQFSILVQKHFNNPNEYEVTFRGLGRLFRKGKGLFFDESPITLRNTSNDALLNADSNYNHFQDLYAQYAHIFLAKGLEENSKGNTIGAMASFRKGLDLVPYCIPCLENLCYLTSKQNVIEARCKTLADSKSLIFNYY